MSSLPIACSLTAPDLAAVQERYRAAASLYQATARISDGHAQISLAGDKAMLWELLTGMIARENACCPFLVFDVAEHSAGYAVRLRVLDASGLERRILREAIDAFFPAATMQPS